MKIKIKWALKVINLLFLSCIVFTTFGKSFVGWVNMGLYDVIIHCAVVFSGGTLLIIYTKVLIQDIIKLLPSNYVTISKKRGGV